MYKRNKKEVTDYSAKMCSRVLYIRRACFHNEVSAENTFLRSIGNEHASRMRLYNERPRVNQLASCEILEITFCPALILDVMPRTRELFFARMYVCN